MNTYVILRRNAWASGEDLEQAAGRSTKVGDDEMSDQVRWIRSYVLDESAGGLGTVCVYQAVSPEAIREHASRADLAVRRDHPGRRQRSSSVPIRRPPPRSARRRPPAQAARVSA